ncbi:MAG: hypothetical protein RIR79_583 [Pseudomonadota bacterium]|jgi:hypothetical protein
MGYQSGSNCYESANSAVVASVSGQTGGVFVFGSPASVISSTVPCNNGNPYCTTTTSTNVPSTIEPYVADVSVDGLVATYKFTGAITGTTFSKAVTLQPQQCQLIDYQDSFLLSGMVVAVWFLAWSFVVLKKAVNS